MTVAHEMLAPRESFWRQRLERFKSLQLPFASSSQEVSPRRQSTAWLSPDALVELLPIDRTECVLAAFLIYLARITGESELQLGWEPAPKRPQVGLKAGEALVASVVPMEVAIDLAHDFAQLHGVVAAECAVLRAHDSFACDLIAR